VTAKQKGAAVITAKTEDGGYKATVSLTVDEAVHAPQGFSPNGDGVNDYFECVLDSRDAYTLNVFDRSGQVYYRSPDYQNDWDGTANTGPHTGHKVPAGTYFYTLSATGSGNAKKGYVIIKY
jgi:gliding motility-associated-like protein